MLVRFSVGKNVLRLFLLQQVMRDVSFASEVIKRSLLLLKAEHMKREFVLNCLYLLAV